MARRKGGRKGRGKTTIMSPFSPPMGKGRKGRRGRKGR